MVSDTSDANLDIWKGASSARPTTLTAIWSAIFVVADWASTANILKV